MGLKEKGVRLEKGKIQREINENGINNKEGNERIEEESIIINKHAELDMFFCKKIELLIQINQYSILFIRKDDRYFIREQVTQIANYLGGTRMSYNQMKENRRNKRIF